MLGFFLRRILALLTVLAGIVVLLPAGMAQAAQGPTAPLTVRLNTGLVHGVDTGTARVFSGIRYAQPPVGSLRWANPVPAAPWSGVLDASQPGAQCKQTNPIPSNAKTSEDCLFVNVTAPRHQSARQLPVMVWLHGGGYTAGAGSLYDAQRLADQGDVVVVTVNYRLGVFGYLGLPGLPGSGDFGLADQVAALQWTKQNAAAFGGDRRNVTLFGESAGGMSACALLTSPASHGLIDKAIVQSGSCLLDWPAGGLYPYADAQTPYASVKQVQDDGLAAAQKLHCTAGSELACLRGKSPEELLPVDNDFANHLAYNTQLLPQNPAQALREGHFLRVPVLSGGTKDENRAFVAGLSVQYPISPETYAEYLKVSFGADADKVAQQYPLSDFRSPALAWATVTTDRVWSCPTLNGDQLLAARTRVYGYEYADDNAPNVNSIAGDFPPGAAHASELPSLFDLGGHPWKFTDDQKKLSDQMVGYWTSFARTGVPRADGAPHWQRFTSAGQNILSLAPNNIHPANYADNHHCGFWSTLTTANAR